MDNFLDNGAVLPHGLLSYNDASAVAGFNKTYKNTSMRMGFVIRSYSISDPSNLHKLTNEYDVSVFEQHEDRGSSIVTYKNCIVSEGGGSIPDFFEKTLRVRTGNTHAGNIIDTTGQNGAIVLIHCLDGMSEKAIIMGSIRHPNRQTTLIDNSPRLVSEFNGINIQISPDGSTSLTFKGATDNDGKVINSSQGNTVVSIENDGSFQVNHSSVTFRMDKSGVVTVTAKGDINLNTDGKLNVQAKGDAIVSCANLNVSASGKADISVGSDCSVISTGKTSIQASVIELDGSLGNVLTTATDKFVDSIFGQPTVGTLKVKAG